MPAARILPFLLISLVCILAPGPDNLSVISYGISRGRRAGMFFGAGCAAGCLLHTFWAFIGVSALIKASVTAFAILKIAGALYLFYLALLAFRSSGLAGLNPVSASDASVRDTVYFRRGFLANALNPKVALFFLAFLPQFTQPPKPPNLPLSVQFLLLGLLFALLTLAVFLIIGAFSGAVGRLLKKHSRLGVWLDRFTGTVFVLLGLKLLFAEVRSNR
jgi:threonine/homoserine/homoserine lactone efflux protein